MPQVDLETLVCGDRKIVCETLIDGPDEQNSTHGPPPDLPAESFRLPTIEDEIDWVNRNAFYERKQSTKGGISSSLPNSGHLPSNPTPSQRVIAKSKPSILGLPKRPDSRQFCQASLHSSRPATIRLFPKPSGSKPSVPEAEPVSPKVSCIGRVTKQSSGRRRSSDGENSRPSRQRRWARFFAVFGRRREQAVVLNDKPPSPPRPLRRREFDVEEDFPAVAAPGLGGMKKLASGRRQASWGGDADVGAVDVVHVAGDDSMEEDTNLWSRRGVGPPRSVECGHDWENAGPVTV